MALTSASARKRKPVSPSSVLPTSVAAKPFSGSTV